MFQRQRQFPLSAGLSLLAVAIWAVGAIADGPAPPTVDEAANHLATAISLAPSPPNVDFLIGQALLKQGKPNLGLGYLLLVPKNDPDFNAAQVLIRSVQKPASISGASVVPSSAESAAILSFTSAYEGNGWQKLSSPSSLGIKGPFQIFQKNDQLVVGIAYHKGDGPFSKIGAQVLFSVRPLIRRRVREVHIIWINRPFEMLEMVYGVDQRSRQFLPKTWILDATPIQIGSPSDVELKTLKKFVRNGF